jgi:hypothetical protein
VWIAAHSNSRRDPAPVEVPTARNPSCTHGGIGIALERPPRASLARREVALRRIVTSSFTALAVAGCSAPVGSNEPAPTTSIASAYEPILASSVSTSDDTPSAAWTKLAFRGAGCDAQFPSLALTSGEDASFLLGLGADVVPVGGQRLACELRGELDVPPGYYLTSFTYTLEYGGAKPAGGRFRLDSDLDFQVSRGDVDVDVFEPLSASYDDADVNQTITRDVSRSERQFCRCDDEHSHVRLSNRLELDVTALSAEVAIGVDSVDVSVAIAPCPVRRHDD